MDYRWRNRHSVTGIAAHCVSRCAEKVNPATRRASFGWFRPWDGVPSSSSFSLRLYCSRYCSPSKCDSAWSRFRGDSRDSRSFCWLCGWASAASASLDSGLLLLCVGKILVDDVWRLNPRDKLFNIHRAGRGAHPCVLPVDTLSGTHSAISMIRQHL